MVEADTSRRSFAGCQDRNEKRNGVARDARFVFWRYCGAVTSRLRAGLHTFAVPVALFLPPSVFPVPPRNGHRSVVPAMVPAFGPTPRGVPVSRLPPEAVLIIFAPRRTARTDHSPSVSYLPSDRGLQAAYRQLCSRVSSAWRFALPTVLASSVETECEVDPTLPSLSRIVCTYMYVRPGPLARPLCLCYMYDTMTQVLSLGGRPRGDRYALADTAPSTLFAQRFRRTVLIVKNTCEMLSPSEHFAAVAPPSFQPICEM